MYPMVQPKEDKYIQDLVRLVKSNYRFQWVDEKELYKLFSIVHFKEYPKGSYVFMEGDEVNSTAVLISGKVEISMSNFRFTEKIFSIVGPGQMLGPSEVFNCHGIHTTNGFCEENSRLAVMDKDKFRSLIFNLPSFSFATSIYMANVIGELRNELTQSNAEIKVLMYLKGLIERDDYSNEKDILTLPKQVTTEKLARMLNITRETVSRTFRNLREKKIIDVQKDCYKILDENRVRNVLPAYSCLPHYHDS